MGDPKKGLFRKFDVVRFDHQDLEGGKHHGCDYFVLDLTHDPYAKPAIEAYIAACKTKYKLLAADLQLKVEGMKARGVR